MAVYAVRCNKALATNRPLRKTTRLNKHRKSVQAYVEKYNIDFCKDPITGEIVPIVTERGSNG